MNDFEGLRITVMGLGRFGGGVGVTRWLAARGASVIVTDLEPADKLAASIAQIQSLVDQGRVTLRLGGHTEADFTDVDAVIANPAVPRPWDNRFIQVARAAMVPVLTEIGLAVQRLPAPSPVIAVTGSVGKSTTSAMIAHILRSHTGNVLFGGNIGGSILADLASLPRGTPIVIEISSAMLYWLSQRPAMPIAPCVAVCTNLSPNHLDWHGDLSHYQLSKQSIFSHQPPGSSAILGEALAHWPTPPGVRRMVIPESARVDELAVPGRHNALNAAMAVEAAASLGLPELTRERAIQLVRGFAGLPHRLQSIESPSGLRCYNDSKSTTPESTRLALDAFKESPGLSRVHLIAGGYDKKIDLSSIATASKDLAGLYVIGTTADAIANAAHHATTHRCGTLDRAVDAALGRARPGDVLLLSPGCASWDQFTNYEERGECFIRLVTQSRRR